MSKKGTLYCISHFSLEIFIRIQWQSEREEQEEMRSCRNTCSGDEGAPSSSNRHRIACRGLIIQSSPFCWAIVHRMWTLTPNVHCQLRDSSVCFLNRCGLWRELIHTDTMQKKSHECANAYTQSGRSSHTAWDIKTLLSLKNVYILLL